MVIKTHHRKVSVRNDLSGTHYGHIIGVDLKSGVSPRGKFIRIKGRPLAKMPSLPASKKHALLFDFGDFCVFGAFGVQANSGSRFIARSEQFNLVPNGAEAKEEHKSGVMYRDLQSNGS